MVTLISKESQQIQLPGGTLHNRRVPTPLTITVETGVAVFTLLGTNPMTGLATPWSFPVSPSATVVTQIVRAEARARPLRRYRVDH